ncbi:fused response regulator/phosphatase [gamma proteobacterium SS-5]|uniref:SpoIIE family protein phosphatase n=1 Tax=Magnetovirga frankeli TaxID=947516 RepID=UPI00129313F5
MDASPPQWRILVVDDVAANRTLLKRYLLGKGYWVDEADSGQAALDLNARTAYDLILMDIMMEGMNGKEATRQIRQSRNDRHLHLPIIYVTALNSQQAFVEALAAGGDDFISKPISFPVLEAKINAHLRIRSLYQQLEQTNADLDRFNHYLRHERRLVQHLLKDAYRRNYKPGCCVRDHIAPVSGFNGDLLLSDLGPGGLFYLMLGDFTGHGLVAAVGTFPVKQSFFQLSEAGASLSDMAREINNHLREFLPPDIFCAAILLQLDLHRGRLSLWSGAMPDAYLFSPAGDLLRQLPSRHMPLGVLEEDEFDATMEVLEIPLDAHLYLHTDGLTEMTNAAGEEFGPQRLQRLLSQPQAGRFEQVIEAFSGYRQGLEQEDDIILVELDLAPVCDILKAPDRPQERPPQAPLMPFRLELELGAEDIRRLDPSGLCSAMLAQQPGLRPHQDMIHSLLAALYSNALEHSLLGLDAVDRNDPQAMLGYYQQRQERLQGLEQARIQLSLALSRDAQGWLLEIGLQDNGRGFAAEASPHQPVQEACGTGGLALLQRFCERLEYADHGRQARLFYRLA